jgi:23S rRNA (adenine2030-N6)-methyltransferase
MFSYRHSFHAGNHADVLKHLCQMLILQKLSIKIKPWTYIDTHSGAGLYSLTSEESQKTAEYLQGIERLVGYVGDCTAILNYQTLVNQFLQQNEYPGSPQIAAQLARENDKLVCLEFHNNEISNLKSNMRGTNAAIHHRDGFEGVLALSPPKPARGMVLIDPPYELANEYGLVVDTVTKLLKKWSSAVVAIWYPLLGGRAGAKQPLSNIMVESLSQLPCNNLLTVELEVEQQDQESGMYGSGLAIINAPWQLDSDLAECIPELHQLLKLDPAATYRIDWRVEG